MSKRNFEDWLTAYVNFASSMSEPPINYHWWSGVSAIAAVLQRKVRMDMGLSGVAYPNFFVILVGPSGEARKGTAASISMDMISKITTIKTIPESLTHQAMIARMRRSIQNYEDPTTRVLTHHCSVHVYSPEFHVFVGTKNTDFLSILNDWWDSKPKWEYETKKDGLQKIVGVCLNMLACCADDIIKEIIPTSLAEGGFSSRAIFVVEEKESKYMPFRPLTPEERIIQEKLIQDLELMHIIKGDYVFTEEAWEFYQPWYIQQRENPPIVSPQFRGYCSRRAVHAVKLGMIMSASRGDDRLITIADFNRALELLKFTERKMPRAFIGFGRGKYTDVTYLILEYIVRAGDTGVKRSETIRNLFPSVDDYIFDICIRTLIAMGMVKLKGISGADQIFAWTGKGKEKLV